MDNSDAVEAAHAGMGTEMAHKAFGRHSVKALRAVENEAQRLERLLSRFLPESDISRINRSAGVKREKISSETYEILSCAMECSVISQGLFDITVGPLTDLWGYKHALEPPANNKIESLRMIWKKEPEQSRWHLSICISPICCRPSRNQR